MQYPTRNSFTKVVEVRPTSGGSIDQKEYTVTANTTIERGDLVLLSSDALVQAMGANATANGANAAYANTNITGVALARITMGATEEAGSGRTKIPVAILNDNCEVLMRLWHATPGSAELQDVSAGTLYEPMRWTSSPNTITWYAATTQTTNGAFSLVEKSQDSLAADDYGLAWFKLIPSRRFSI